MNRIDLGILWFISAFASLTVIAGKLAFMLFAIAVDPPLDPALAANWVRRRRWLAYSELSAFPAFATIAVAATLYFNLPPVASVLISMALGGLGFGFLLDGLQFVVRRKLGMPQ